MSTLHSLVAGLALGGAIGAGVMFIQADRSGMPGDRPHAAHVSLDGAGTGAELAALRREVAALRTQMPGEAEAGDVKALWDQVQQLRMVVARLESRDAAGGDAGPDVDDATMAVVDPEEQIRARQQEQAAHQARVLQHFADLDAAVRNERVDQVWSAGVSMQVTEAFAREPDLGNVALDNVDCRATRCRVEMSFDADADIDDVEAALAGAMADETPRMAVHFIDADADTPTKRAVVYLVRSGYGLAD